MRSVQVEQPAVGQSQHRRRMAGGSIAHGPAASRAPLRLRPRVEHRGQPRHLERLDQAVQPVKYPSRSIPTVRIEFPGTRLEQPAQLSHRGGSLDVVPDDVADGKPHRSFRQDEHVVEVAAHLGTAVAREVTAGKCEAGDLGQLRQQTLLQHLRDAVLTFVEAGVIDDKGRPAPQIGGEAQILGRVNPAGRPGHQGDAAEHPAASGQRNIHGRADAQGVAQRQQLLVVHIPTRRLDCRVGVEGRAISPTLRWYPLVP